MFIETLACRDCGVRTDNTPENDVNINWIKEVKIALKCISNTYVKSKLKQLYRTPDIDNVTSKINVTSCLALFEAASRLLGRQLREK